MKLTILRGVSGSGKSTWANSQFGAVVVSRDNLRFALFGSDGPDYYARKDLRSCEDVITRVEHEAINAALRAGRNVVSDNTHIDWRYVKAIAAIGYAAGAEVEVKVFDCSLAVAKTQNRLRAASGGRNVPEDVLEKQYARFQSNKKNKLIAPEPMEVIPYTGTPGKPKAFLFDLDGTCFHMNGKRSPYAHNVEVDDPDPVILDIVARLIDSGLVAIAMSGREEATRAATEKALHEWVGPRHLFMRANKDMRKDSIVKHELFNNYVRDNFDVQFVLDDRQQVVDMWRRMGLKCLQVEEGAF